MDEAKGVNKKRKQLEQIPVTKSGIKIITLANKSYISRPMISISLSFIISLTFYNQLETEVVSWWIFFPEDLRVAADE